LWDLNPFFNIQNNFNIRTGNPELLPEFADSYEFTTILLQDKWSLNTSIYHLYTTDVTESVSFYNDGVNLTTRENVGTNRKTGLEISGKYNPLKWLSINGDFNYGFFNRQGEFEGRIFDFKGDQYSGKFTAKLKLKKNIDVEFSPNYQSAFSTLQGSSSGFVSLDAGIRKKVLKEKAVVSIGLRDVFASRIQESFVDQTDFYLRSFSQRGRFLTFGFSYSFGKGEVMSYTGGGRRG
jgi:outer membrane receptor protein involved in Fe transport